MPMRKRPMPPSFERCRAWSSSRKVGLDFRGRPAPSLAFEPQPPIGPPLSEAHLTAQEARPKRPQHDAAEREKGDQGRGFGDDIVTHTERDAVIEIVTIGIEPEGNVAPVADVRLELVDGRGIVSQIKRK